MSRATSKIGPIGQVVIQSTSLCNLNCSYCYLTVSERQSNHQFPIENVPTVFGNLMKSDYALNRLNILFHAGEPLAAGIDYYRRFLAELDTLKIQLGKPDFEFEFCIQTNATLITQEWCDFVQEKNIRIGVSCDGPAIIHDATRKNWAGAGTLNAVLKGMSLLKKNTIPFSVLSVVSPLTLNYAKEFIGFFVENNIRSIGILPLDQLGIQKDNPLGDENLKRKYTEFLKILLAEIEKNKLDLKIRECDIVLEAILHQDNHYWDNTPLALITIDHQGNFSTFSPDMLTNSIPDYEDGNLVLGNLLEENIDDVIHKPKFKRMWAEIQGGIEKCRQSCDYFQVCGGGLPSVKINQHNTFDVAETTDCVYRIKLVADVMMEKLLDTPVGAAILAEGQA